MAREKVLVVDDDAKTCANIQRYLGGRQMAVEVANNVEIALAKVEDFKPQCVLLDIRLPKVNGIECLKTLRKQKPEIAVIMVTGIDHGELKEGCLKAGASGYMVKPVDMETMYGEILKAVEACKLSGDSSGEDDSEEVDSALNAIDIVDDVVASPPTIYQQLQQAVDNPEATFKDFERIISTDPALSARLLKVVNSPFYGFPSKINTVAHALNIVGIDQLTDLALATGVLTQFNGIPKDLVSMDAFWRHSIACGLGARVIARNKGLEKEVERYYLAGMLHDLGSLVLYKETADRSRDILTHSREEQRHLYAVETEKLGFNHADVGRTLMKKWELPASLIEAVTFHHDPMKAGKFRQQAAVVHVADIMAYSLGLGASGEPLVPDLSDEVLNEIGLTVEDIEGFKPEVAQEFEQVSAMFM